MSINNNRIKDLKQAKEIIKIIFTENKRADNLLRLSALKHLTPIKR